MEEPRELLAAFLADPALPAVRIAYINWLDKQGDVRGEYLRLLTDLDEVTDPVAATPARLRLRELRRQIPADWAEAVDRTLLAFGQLYQADWGDGSFHHLRFYADRAVIAVSSPETSPLMEQWFINGKQPPGRWSLVGDQLSFFIPHQFLMDPEVMHPQFSGDLVGWQEMCKTENAEIMRRRSEYDGVVGRQSLALKWHSHTNDRRGVLIYRLMPPLAPHPT
jgi:hypothetical protein